MRDNSQKTKVTAEKLKKVMKGDKTEMSNEDATRMLLFLKRLARIAVKKYLER
ncbi:hypothetical protein M3B46_12090 [Sphingobacterium daejeonense]|uniref:Uncharacterized protein n=1 Tax=Sphingobacterium multivorum TaxID=28454 RepID=A0A653ZSG1_SPHMU|nr:hypothetical protein [Sphingobacterium daejeonense]MCT1531742.1 hypothetical protein [Sphingobacterium daejeonense]VXC57301.1 conserved hypothetical protein [Sphingobacterium multivorum]